MIEAGDFIAAARARGFSWYAGVPCSYLTPFINYVIQAPGLRYLSAANEGDAVALIAGTALAGSRGVAMMQNSGLGNAVSPLTSLTWTFRLRQLLIVTWRGEPGTDDEPQHQLSGPITPKLLETMEIPWELFPAQPDEVPKALDRAVAHMDASGRPYALLMRKNTVKPYALAGHGAPAPRSSEAPESRIVPGTAPRVTRVAALHRIISLTPPDKTVVIATTGYTGRELFATDDRPNQLYMVGSMGCVAAVALGLALARPDLTVVAVDGDGAALMRMGIFTTVGAYGPPNLIHVLLDNAAHESTGGQATVSAGVSFAAIASASGYARAIEGDELALLDELFGAPAQGPRFLRLRIRQGILGTLPRPTQSPEQVRARLMRHIGAAK